MTDIASDLPTETVRPDRLAGVKRFFTAYPPGVLLGLSWILLMLVLALGADYLTPYSFTAFDLKARLQPPIGMGGAFNHALGTDELGRDVLSRLIMSIRMSILIAFFGTLIAATMGTMLGLIAAHFRGKEIGRAHV